MYLIPIPQGIIGGICKISEGLCLNISMKTMAKAMMESLKK